MCVCLNEVFVCVNEVYVCAPVPSVSWTEWPGPPRGRCWTRLRSAARPRWRLTLNDLKK